MSTAAMTWARKCRGLTPTQKLVLFVLADTANPDTCFIASKGIAADSGLSEKTVRTALHSLLDAGVIQGDMRPGIRPLWTLAVAESGNCYRLKRNLLPLSKRNLLPLSNLPSRSPKRNLLPIKAVTVTDEPREVSKKEREITLSLPVPRREAEPDAFDAWWKAYPKRVGKDDARKAYAKATKRGATDADLATGLQRQRWPSELKFIPNPATWLNQGRWQDDPHASAPRPAEPENRLAWMDNYQPFAGDRTATSSFDFEGTSEEVH